METFRLKIRPLSPWQTPWQSDTLAGLLCWAYGRNEGSQALTQNLLTRFVSGDPPFILSDAFPGDLFPIPDVVRTAPWPIEHRKKVGKAVYLHRAAFQKFMNGEHLSMDDLAAADPIRATLRTRNMISRISNTTGDAGSLFALREHMLDQSQDFLSVYVRLQPNEIPFVLDLFHSLQQTGFGADTTSGNGEFEIIDEFEPMPWLDYRDPQSSHFTVLSTFQPAANDSVNGLWQPFIKYGKVGPDFGLENVFKRPLVMFRSGACFQEMQPASEWVGRVIEMDELLSSDAIKALRNENIEICHIATGLTVPYRESTGVDAFAGSESRHSKTSSLST